MLCRKINFLRLERCEAMQEVCVAPLSIHHSFPNRVDELGIYCRRSSSMHIITTKSRHFNRSSLAETKETETQIYGCTRHSLAIARIANPSVEHHVQHSYLECISVRRFSTRGLKPCFIAHCQVKRWSMQHEEQTAPNT